MNDSGGRVESYGMSMSASTYDGHGIAFETNGYVDNSVNSGYQIRFAHAPDTAAPTWAAGATVSADNVTGTSMALHWPAATDDTGVTGYSISEDGTLVADALTATSCQVHESAGLPHHHPRWNGTASLRHSRSRRHRAALPR